MLNTRARQHGMSLIEVMVGITIAALLLAVGLPSFSKGMQNRKIRTAATAIQGGLMQARSEALRRNRIVKFQLGDQNSWSVGCATPDTTVIDGEQACPAVLQARDGAGEGTAQAAVAKNQLVQSTGAIAVTGVFVGSVNFTPLGRTTPDTLPGGNIAEYLVSNPAGTCAKDGGELRCLSVRVTSTGQIRMCDPAVTAAGDPRAC